MENIFYLNGNSENVAFQPIWLQTVTTRAASQDLQTILLSLSLFYDPHLYSLHINAKKVYPKSKNVKCIFKTKTKSEYTESLSGQCGGRLNVRNEGLASLNVEAE